MKRDILQKFDDLFGNLDLISTQKVEEFVHESLRFFEELRLILLNGTDEEKKEGMAIALQLQSKLEEAAARALKISGMDADKLMSFVKNPSNFKQEEWSSLKRSEKEIADYQKEVVKETSRHVAPLAAPKKRTKKWIAG